MNSSSNNDGINVFYSHVVAIIIPDKLQRLRKFGLQTSTSWIIADFICWLNYATWPNKNFTPRLFWGACLFFPKTLTKLRRIHICFFIPLARLTTSSRILNRNMGGLLPQITMYKFSNFKCSLREKKIKNKNLIKSLFFYFLSYLKKTSILFATTYLLVAQNAFSHLHRTV